MAFIDIKDPMKREEIVKDYIKNIKEIRERRENEKVRGISQRQDLAKVFQPVVQATEKSASQITSQLKNLKEEVQDTKPLNNTLEYWFTEFDRSKLDQYFGIYKENGNYMMGDKEIEVDDKNNIYLDNGAISFKGTHGLWRLIMFKTPVIYDPEDLENYTELLKITNAIDIPHKTNAGDKPKNTAKWRFFKDQGLVRVEESEEEEEVEKKERKDGQGIQFLPGNIKGLIERLHLLLAEFRAGNNSSTRNQIVAILDELLRRNYLNQEEYNAVCETISC
jgi:hypothetical protein